MRAIILKLFLVFGLLFSFNSGAVTLEWCPFPETNLKDYVVYWKEANPTNWIPATFDTNDCNSLITNGMNWVRNYNRSNITTGLTITINNSNFIPGKKYYFSVVPRYTNDSIGAYGNEVQYIAGNTNISTPRMPFDLRLSFIVKTNLSTNGLVAYWPMTNDWNDRVGNHHLTTFSTSVVIRTINGMSATYTYPIPNQISNYAYLLTPHTPSLNAQTNMTISMWFNPDFGTNGSATIMDKNFSPFSQANAAYRIVYARTTSNVTVRFGNGLHSPTNRIIPRQWNHILTWTDYKTPPTAGTRYVQINGGPIETNSVGFAYTNHTGNLFICGISNLAVALPAYYSHIRFYHTNLDAEDRAVLYNNGIPK